MTNPNQTVRIHSRNGGRASVYEANAPYQSFSTGLLRGNGVTPTTGLNIMVGGSQTNPDVVIGENPTGYKIALDLVSPVTLALTSPGANSKIVSIVAYTDDLALDSNDQTTTTGSPSSCGLIAVNGTIAASPSKPDDATIRAAITADGATGSQAVYAIIANILLSSSTTDVTSSLITTEIADIIIRDGSITAKKLDLSTFSAVTISGDTEATCAANTVIPLTKTFARIGSEIVRNDSSVVIGEGVSRVIVSANVFMSNSSLNYGWFGLQKNNSLIQPSRTIANLASSSYGSAVLSPIILEVQEGDVLRLINLDSVKIRANESYMTVRQIG